MDTREQIKKILKQTLQIEHINDNISQTNCDKWDSLNHLNLIVKLECEFDLSFEPEEIVEMNSLGAIKKIISMKKGTV